MRAAISTFVRAHTERTQTPHVLFNLLWPYFSWYTRPNTLRLHGQAFCSIILEFNMSEDKMDSFKALFSSRLDTLSHILDVSKNHFQKEGDTILGYRITEDMLPFGTQIAFTCNQPRNFTLWCEGREMDNLSPEVESLDKAKTIIEETKLKLANININDEKLQDIRRIDVAENQYLELPGIEYVNDFLVPNLYFHLVTAYNIMRLKGAPLGKFNYMVHLAPKVKQA